MMKTTGKDKNKSANETGLRQTVITNKFKFKMPNEKGKQNPLSRMNVAAGSSSKLRKHLEETRIRPNYNAEITEKLQEEIDLDVASQMVQDSTVLRTKIIPFSLNLSRNAPVNGRPDLNPSKKTSAPTPTNNKPAETRGSLILVPPSTDSKKFISCHFTTNDNFNKERPKDLKQMLLDVQKFSKTTVPFIPANDQAWQLMQKCLRWEENMGPVTSRDINIEWIKKNAGNLNTGTPIPFLMTCVTDDLHDGNYVKLRDETGVILAKLSDEMVTLFKDQLVQGTCIGLKSIPIQMEGSKPILKVGLESILCITSRREFQRVPAAAEGRIVVIHGKNLEGVGALLLQGLIYADFRQETQDMIGMIKTPLRLVENTTEHVFDDDDEDICLQAASMASQKLADPQFKTSSDSTVINMNIMKGKENITRSNPTSSAKPTTSLKSKKNDIGLSANAFKVPFTPPPKKSKRVVVYAKPTPPPKSTGFTQDDGNDDLILQAGIIHDENKKN